MYPLTDGIHSTVPDSKEAQKHLYVVCFYNDAVKCLFSVDRSTSVALERNLVKLQGLGINASRVENIYFFKYANQIGHPQRPFISNSFDRGCDV